MASWVEQGWTTSLPPFPLEAIPSSSSLICDRSVSSHFEIASGEHKASGLELLIQRKCSVKAMRYSVWGSESLWVGTWAGRMLLQRMSGWVWGQIAKNFSYHLWGTKSPVSDRKWAGIFAVGEWQDFFFFFERQTWNGVSSSTLCQVGNKPDWVGMGGRLYRGWCFGCARQMVRAWSGTVTAEMGTSMATQQRLNESDLSIDVSTIHTDKHILGVVEF